VAPLQNLVYTDLIPVMANRPPARARRGVGRDRRRRTGDFCSLCNVPGSRYAIRRFRPFKGFAERDALLDNLDRMLWQGPRVCRPAQLGGCRGLRFAGLGGVGKTVLAKEYAWRNRDRYPWHLVDPRRGAGNAGRRPSSSWASASSPGWTAWSRYRRRWSPSINWRRSKPQKPWLLIYDNVNDPSSIRLLTPATNAHVLITTRRTNWDGEAEELPVDVFDRDTAINFLVQDDSDREAAGRLADALDRLPLALSHARAYCRARKMTFDRYIANLPKLVDQVPRNAQYPASVFQDL